MIINHRPHILQYQVTSEGYEDENGDFHKGESQYEGNIPCRYSPNGKAEEMVFEDGVERTYSATIRLDNDCRLFSIGDCVRILLSNGIIRDYVVKGFHQYQTYSKLWV